MNSQNLDLKQNKITDHHEENTAVFCSGIVWVANIAYLVMRKGFVIDFQALSILSGISFYLLFAPSLIHKSFPTTKRNNMYFGNIPLRVYSFLLFSLIGFVLGGLAIYIGFIFAALGYGCFAYSMFRFLQKFDLQRLLIITVSIFLAAWTVVKVWGIFSLHPLFIEAVAMLKETDLPYLQDTLYHASMAQMIKTYGIPSTGIDGLPYMYYHYGSHWLFGHFSTFVGLNVITMYVVGYLIVFVPLFFYSFVVLVIQLQQVLLGRIVTNGYFWLAVLCFFIPLPKGGYSLGLLGMSLLVNESQTVSMIFLFGLLSICLNFETDFSKNKITFILIIPLMVTAIAFLKISTAFVIVPLLVYIYLRYQGYKNGWLTVGIALCAIGFIFAYLCTVETVPFLRTKSDEGTFSYFHFYKKTHPFNPLHWFLWFYFWAYAVIVLSFIYRKKIMAHRPSFRWIGIEAVIITALVGVAPSIFMTFSGGNSMYFSNIQLYISGLFCLGIFPLIDDLIKNFYLRWRRAVFLSLRIAFVAAIFIITWVEIRGDLRFMIKKSIQVRFSCAGKDYSHLPYRIKLSGSYIKEAYQIPTEKLIQSAPSYRYLMSLSELDEIPLSVKKTTVVFKPCICPNDIQWNFNCIVRSHLMPAFTGLASIRGIPDGCGIGVYGDTYYPDHYLNPDKKLSAQEAYEKANSEGFKRVLFYDCVRNEFAEQISYCLAFQE